MTVGRIAVLKSPRWPFFDLGLRFLKICAWMHSSWRTRQLVTQGFEFVKNWKLLKMRIFSKHNSGDWAVCIALVRHEKRGIALTQTQMTSVMCNEVFKKTRLPTKLSTESRRSKCKNDRQQKRNVYTTDLNCLKTLLSRKFCCSLCSSFCSAVQERKCFLSQLFVFWLFLFWLAWLFVVYQ